MHVISWQYIGLQALLIFAAVGTLTSIVFALSKPLTQMSRKQIAWATLGAIVFYPINATLWNSASDLLEQAHLVYSPQFPWALLVITTQSVYIGVVILICIKKARALRAPKELGR